MRLLLLAVRRIRHTANVQNSTPRYQRLVRQIAKTSTFGDMLAAVLHGPHDLRVEEVADVVPGPGEVTIGVVHNGLCGSDLKLYETGLRAITEPHPTTHHCGPQILGHEFSGTVVAVGAEVVDMRTGDRVCIEPLYPCGACGPCRLGLAHLCQILTFHGVVSSGGGLSQRTTLPASMVRRLPDGLTMQQGALIEPMSVSYHAIERADAQPGQRAVVFGGGPIGIGVVLGLRARGVDDVTVVEPSAVRRKVLSELGAVVVDVDDAPVGVSDIAFDCAGVPSAFQSMLRSVRVRGRAVVVAGSAKYPLEISAHMLQHTEILITGSVAFESHEFATVMDLMKRGAYPLDGWVEHIPFAQVVEEGFAPLLRGQKTKVLVDLPHQ
jgi:(R,R)-butanediol dehydrogenase / meso-butanediol dehydrogenase / diacetyl reductase